MYGTTAKTIQTAGGKRSTRDNALVGSVHLAPMATAEGLEVHSMARQQVHDNAAIVGVVEASDVQARRMGAAENLQREDLSALETVAAIVEMVDAELIEAPSYAELGPTPLARVKSLLMKLDSDRRHGTDYFAHKFVGQVERIFAALPKPQEWRSFYEHDLPLLTRLDRDVQDLAIAERLNKSQAEALHTLKREAPQKYRQVARTGGVNARQDLLDWRAGLEEVPCWVRAMDDDEAFMQLVLCNAQGELSPLELGIHVLTAVRNGSKGRGKKGGLRGYAQQVSKAETYLRQLRQAAEVYRVVTAENARSTTHFLDKAMHLAAIHKAPRDTWPVLAQTLLQQGWTVDDTDAAVAWVISQNLERRHLSSSQAAACAVEALPLLEEEARQRQLAQAERGQEGGRGHKKTLPQPVGEGFPPPDKHAGEATQQAAKKFGSNREYVAEAKRLKAEDPGTG